MIDTIEEFERLLNELNPDDDAFVLQTDKLICELEPLLNDKVYPAIFRFFESHADADCGAPGTLVHFVEHYYPNYVEALLDSVRRTTSYNGVLMVHRILNSKIDDDLRRQLLSVLTLAADDVRASKQVREMAAEFVTLHS